MKQLNKKIRYRMIADLLLLNFKKWSFLCTQKTVSRRIFNKFQCKVIFCDTISLLDVINRPYCGDFIRIVIEDKSKRLRLQGFWVNNNVPANPVDGKTIHFVKTEQ